MAPELAGGPIGAVAAANAAQDTRLAAIELNLPFLFQVLAINIEALRSAQFNYDRAVESYRNSSGGRAMQNR
jgi:hypothetical protein